MKQGVYYQLEKKQNRYKAKQSTGYIDQENQLAYEEESGYGYKWKCTDILSGYMIAWGKTRKECENAAKNNLPEIIEMREHNRRNGYYCDYTGMKQILEYLITKGGSITEQTLKRKFC